MCLWTIFFWHSLFHIFNSGLAYILEHHKTAYIFISLVYSVLLVFLHFFYESYKKLYILLSCLVYSVSGTVIYYGMYMITRTLAYAGLIVILYLLYKKDENNRGFAYQGLAILLTMFLVIVHQVSAAQIAVILFLLLVCEHILSNESYINTHIFIILHNVHGLLVPLFKMCGELLLLPSDVHF